ncbi:hypothetical protein PMPD1_2511 [Paramixta manurensis]|uniref:Uncharacterized protein n=1 Tax=Paramixta manurensis TaxID=2740817 RepID=A0A6M8UQM4_9GAMM|nr:hypothetical protein PMPD1_2511 [Erwiniaceae bacterium PD-1]
MSKLAQGFVHIDIDHNQYGGLSLSVCNDDVGYRISGGKIGGCENLERFTVNADELIKAIQEHVAKGGDHA